MGWSGRAQNTRPASTVHRRPAGSHAAISATSCRTAPVPAWTSPAQGAPAGGRAARGGAARAAARLRAAAPIPLLLCAPIRGAPRWAAADAAAGAALLPTPTQAPAHTRNHHQSPPRPLHQSPPRPRPAWCIAAEPGSGPRVLTAMMSASSRSPAFPLFCPGSWIPCTMHRQSFRVLARTWEKGGSGR